MTEIKRLYGAIGGDIIGSVYEFNVEHSQILAGLHGYKCIYSA